jgi:2-haloacid dehalogenase
MGRVILFDVNETLLDLAVIQPHFQRVFGDPAISQQWFSLLLHSSLVTTLTSIHIDFGSLAGAALDLVAARQGISLAKDDRSVILTTLQHLPPHPDVGPSLERLHSAGLRLATLTNSSPGMVGAQIANAGLQGYFEQLISVEEARRFKPAPEPYRIAASKLGVAVEQLRLVAAHDWDVHGALHAGCHGAYIARRGRLYHPLYTQPDIMGPDLLQVTDRILELDV